MLRPQSNHLVHICCNNHSQQPLAIRFEGQLGRSTRPNTTQRYACLSNVTLEFAFSLYHWRKTNSETENVQRYACLSVKHRHYLTVPVTATACSK
jgi:hypothetical protein